mgnify:CR=1 FL=1
MVVTFLCWPGYGSKPRPDDFAGAVTVSRLFFTVTIGIPGYFGSGLNLKMLFL